MISMAELPTGPRTPDQILDDFALAAQGKLGTEAIHALVWEVITDISSSYVLAMNHELWLEVDRNRLRDITTTVLDYAGNHYGEI